MNAASAENSEDTAANAPRGEGRAVGAPSTGGAAAATNGRLPERRSDEVHQQLERAGEADEQLELDVSEDEGGAAAPPSIRIVWLP